MFCYHPPLYQAIELQQTNLLEFYDQAPSLLLTLATDSADPRSYITVGCTVYDARSSGL